MKKPTKPPKPLKFDVASVVKSLKKEYADAICILGDPVNPISLAPGRISTGAINLDWATGGGIPTGRITEIYSRKESQGKSTLACSIMREAQRVGAHCLYLDTEQVAVGTRLAELGLKKGLGYGQPDSIEETFQLTDAFIRNSREGGHKGEIVVVVDSIAAMNTEEQLEKDYGEATMASLARAMSNGLRKLNRVVSDMNATIIFTNQVRQKVGISYGETLTTPGGLALRFYTSLRLELKTMEKIYGVGKKELGITVRATVKKSKVCQPFQVADLDIMFSHGVDPVASAFRFALQRELISRDGNSYTFKPGYGNGTDPLPKSFLRTKFGEVLLLNPQVSEVLKAELGRSFLEVSNTNQAVYEDVTGTPLHAEAPEEEPVEDPDE